MASFGWSVGDVIAISTLAWKLYKTCESAGEEFQSLAKDVQALQSLLKDVGHQLQDPLSIVHKAGKSKRQQLINLLDDCNTDLRDLERYLLQYKSLKSAKPRLRDRLRFGIKPISQIRLKLSQHTDNLNLFLAHVNTTSLGRLEQVSDTNTGILDEIRAKLDDLRRQVQLGQKDVSLLDAESNWPSLKNELVGERVTERDVASNRDSIQEYITTWLATTHDARPGETNHEKGAGNRRTSSMMPWAPTGPIGLSQVVQMSNSVSLGGSADPGLTPPDAIAEMWNLNGRDSPSISSETPCSEVISQFSESVFDPPSSSMSRATTPDVPEKPMDCGVTTSPSLSGLTRMSPYDQGIESLIDELDAFVLDISRSSSPNIDEASAGEAHNPITYTLEERPSSTSSRATLAPRMTRRVITKSLPLSLEEAFRGGVKSQRIRGRLLTRNGCGNEPELRESTIKVHYPAGTRTGDCVEVQNVAIDPQGFVQDLQFIIALKPHNLYQWDGEDLTCVINITLLESLCGWTRSIRSIDGNVIRLNRSEVTPPTWSTIFPRLGMPSPNETRSRSNLIVKVNVEFPNTISPYQEKIFRRTLAPPVEIPQRMQLLYQQSL